MRALAAIYVVLYHIAAAHPFPGSATVRFGPDAVLAFFLLSGFVIYANERDRVARPRGYYVRRIRRIYPGLIVACAIGTLVFAANGTLGRAFNLGSLLGTLAGVQDLSGVKPGVVTDPYLGMNPLWSLSFELFFYLVFPLLMRIPQALRTDAIGAVAIVGYATYLAVPNHVSLVSAYLLVWWLGAALARSYLDNGVMSGKAVHREVAWLLGLIAVALVGVALKGRHGFGYFPELQARNFVLALVFVALAVSPLAGVAARSALRLREPIVWMASISYGLYLVHYPLVAQWTEASTTGGLVLALLLSVAAAYLADRALPRLLPRAPSD